MNWLLPSGRLKNRLTLVMVLALMVPISIVSWYAWQTTTRALVHNVEANLEDDLKTRLSSAQDLLTQPRDDLYELSQNANLHQILELNVRSDGVQTKEAEAALHSFIDHSGGLYVRAYWLDERGNVLLTTDTSGIELTPSYRESLFSGAAELVGIPKRLSIFVGEMELGKHFTSGTDSSVIPYVLAMRHRDGGIGGALVVELDVNSVFRELEQNHLGPEHSTWVLDDKGVALMKPANVDADLWLKQRPHDAQTILSNPSGALFDTPDRPKVVQAFARIRPTSQSSIRWTVVDEMPLERAMAEVRWAQGIFLALSLSCLGLAIWWARRITRSIVSPLESLAMAAQTVEEEGADVELPSKIDTKEISNLAMAFKAMRTRIRGLLTAIRLSENSLKDSLWAMNEAQRIGQVGTYVTDIKTGFWQGSEVLDDIFGIDATFKKTIPNWDSLVAPESRQELLDYYYQVISGDGNFHKEYEVIRPSDGQRVWVEALGQVSFDEAGDPEFLRGTISDIHKRKTAELALQLYKNQLEELVRQKTAEVERQKDQLQLISDVLPGTVYQFMRTAQGESKFLYLSKGIGSLYEVNATEALKDGDLLTRCILPEDRQSHSESIDRSYQELSEWEHWHRIMTPSGKLKWVRGRASPHKIADGSVVWTGFLVDVTEWKKVEETAQAADRSKSEFLANMSHEIRTPMSGVIGMVDILLQTPLSPRQQHMLTTVANSSQTLLDILNDILDFSKIEAGKMMVEQIPARLREVADSVLQLMQSKASEKGMTLSMAISPDLPAAIYTDPTRLRQVLLNLLGNAIKFTPPDAVGADGVTLTLEPGALPDGQPAVLLRVRDHGIGMDAEVQSRLFTSFNQADASTSRQFGGTGLGLSISRRLVTLMGGTISVQSAPGAGSEFTVALPMQEAFVEKTNSDASDVQLQFHSGTITADQAAALGQLILVAEDNETNREVIEEQLRLLGYACEIAHDGAIALQTWKAAPSRYALLLTDGHMPQMDGFELTKAIRDAEAPGKRMPIIAITANAMQGEDQRCLTIGMDDYLSKPMRLRELASMLKKWLPIGDTQDRNATVVDCQPTRPVAPELADWNSLTLGQLVGDNPAIHRRLLEKFLANANRQVLEIGTVLAARKFKEVAALAHMLKSAARSVGALALGELCQQIEATGRDDDAHACTELTQKLPAIFALAQQAIQEHLDS